MRFRRISPSPVDPMPEGFVPTSYIDVTGNNITQHCGHWLLPIFVQHKIVREGFFGFGDTHSIFETKKCCTGMKLFY
jgi:hypothetical protein